MSQLSPYHLRRSRLTSRVLGAGTSVIVGGAGYGKSALAAEAILAVESFRSDWFDGCGGDFPAEAASFLDRVGPRG